MEEPEGESPRVLLADDNPEIRRLLVAVLVRDGYETEAVADGQQAIEKIRESQYDAILLDLMMPIASGLDVLRWIDENRREVGKSCVILLTAAIRELATFDPTKVYATITKPFDLNELRETVKRCIAAKQRHQD